MSSPHIWLLTGSKAGDNAQALRLAEATGMPFERRRIALRPGFDLAKPRVQASLHHVDLAASDPLMPPWPDLVLTIGRRMAMVALWIKRQSGARTRLALIGPPKRQAGQFDLIVAPLHYRIAEQPNVCRIGLPLLGIDPAAIAAEGERRRAQFCDLPRPLTVLLCGGSTGTHSFDPVTARSIVGEIGQLTAREGGSLQVTTSRRTPAETVAALAEALPTNAGFYRWQASADDNPYLGLLAHGDRFVVTGDSISMLIEVARLGKPLAIAPLRPANRTVARALGRLGFPERMTFAAAGAAGAVVNRLAGAPVRDFTLLHDLMYRKGWAVPLGQPFTVPAEPPGDDIRLAADRLRALLIRKC